VFSNFDPDLHVVKELPDEPMDAIRIGVDYGAANPTVFIKLCRYKTKWIAVEEFYHRPKDGSQYTNAQYKDQMIKFIGNYYPSSMKLIHLRLHSFMNYGNVFAMFMVPIMKLLMASRRSVVR